MKYIRKNIWELFAVTMVTGLLIFAYVLYSIWGQVSLRYALEQENIARISAHSTKNMLAQYEVTLDILGAYLVKDNTYKDVVKSKRVLKNLLKTNPSIAGLGLVNPAGKLYVTSINKSVDELPNLFEKEETRESFLEVFKSDTMVLGRTYFHNTLKTFIVPIRKAIKDKNGTVIAIMTAGIKVDNWYASLKNQSKVEITQNKSFLLRDSDYYLQIAPYDSKLKKTYYNQSFPKEFIKNIEDLITKSNNISIEKLKDSETVVSVKFKHYLDDEVVLSSFVFIKKYKLWRMVQIKFSILIEEFYKRAIPVIVIFTIIGLFLLFLFIQLSKTAKKNRLKLEYQAEHDYHTKLYNRYYVSKKFKDNSSLRPYSLIVINMDNFKNINENYGHECGDLTLKTIAKRLEKICIKDDILVRYSGDEFLFIRYDTQRDEVPELAEKIINLLYKPYRIGEFYFILGASLGIAGFPSDGDYFNEVKKFADIALHEAKKKKNTYLFFEDSIKEKYLRNSLIEQELKVALLNNEVHMVYQPQIKVDGSFDGVEALVRWQNDKLGFVPPDEFIKIAENTGMMVKLGQYVIDKSLSEICQIQSETNQKFNLSINISLKQFVEPDFYEDLLKSLTNSGFDKSLLTLEVTENIFIEDVDQMLQLLEKVRKEGIKISLDDFGTGYSSLSLLKKLPINELKIDKSFVDDIENDVDAEKMVNGIILIAKQLDMSILAEGIEQEEQKNILTKYGCNMFQGYYFSKPLSKEDLLDFI